MKTERAVGSGATDVVRQIVERYVQAPPTFTVHVAEHAFEFRRIFDTVEMMRLYAGQQEFGREASSKQMPGALAEVTPCMDARVAEAAYVISELSIEPKLTQYDALVLARFAEPVFTALMTEVLRYTQEGVQATEVQRVEHSKNGSARTRSGVSR